MLRYSYNRGLNQEKDERPGVPRSEEPKSERFRISAVPAHNSYSFVHQCTTACTVLALYEYCTALYCTVLRSTA